MPEEITRLMNLQNCDLKLRELEEKLGAIAGGVEEIRRRNEQWQSELDHLNEQERQAAQSRRNLERELADGEAQIRNKRMRMNLVRNDRELQALTFEVETLKEGNQRLETEVLGAMEEVGIHSERIKELGELIAGGRAELKAAEKEVAGEVERLKTSIAAQRRDRTRLAGQVEATLLKRYEMIASRRAGVAVAHARSGTCEGCRMLLPPQIFNEIRQHSKIHFCPNCQRILYCED